METTVAPLGATVSSSSYVPGTRPWNLALFPSNSKTLLSPVSVTNLSLPSASWLLENSIDSSVVWLSSAKDTTVSLNLALFSSSRLISSSPLTATLSITIVLVVTVVVVVASVVVTLVVVSLVVTFVVVVVVVASVVVVVVVVSVVVVVVTFLMVTAVT